MKIKLLSILLLCLFTSCSNSPKNEEVSNSIIIDINDYENFIEKDFFEIFYIDTLIDLEFKEDFYLGNLYRFKKGINEYYALDPFLGNLIRFSKDGKALNRIGEIGPGPMEMPEIDDFAYDQENNELLLSSYSSMKISRFKPDGKFVSSIKLKEQLDQFSYSEDRYAVSMTYFNSLYKNFALLNSEGDTIKTYFPFPTDLSPISLKFISGHITNSIQGGFLFNEPASSKIYSISSNGDFEVKYEFIGGSDVWPERNKDLIGDFFQTLSKGELTYITRFYEESTDYFFFNINIKKSSSRAQIIDPRFGYYDHKDKITYVSKSHEALLRMKGPLEVENNMFYCYISKANLNELKESDKEFADILDNFPHLLLNDLSDFDTPVLVRFKVRI